MPRRLKPDVRLAAMELQLMVRAEAASLEIDAIVVVNGIVTTQWSARGHCACITCGKVLPYKSAASHGFDQMQGGHFCHHVRTKLVIPNVNPQCAGCNKWRYGAHAEYTTWMEAQDKGEAIIAELRDMKNGVGEWKNYKWKPDFVIDFREQMRKRINDAKKIINQ